MELKGPLPSALSQLATLLEAKYDAIHSTSSFIFFSPTIPIDAAIQNQLAAIKSSEDFLVLYNNTRGPFAPKWRELEDMLQEWDAGDAPFDKDSLRGIVRVYYQMEKYV